MSIGENIKRIREQQDLKQYELAEKLNVTQPTITQWENGKRFPQSDRLVEIADVLRCSVEDLVETDYGLADYCLKVDYTEEYEQSISRLEQVIKKDPDPVWVTALEVARKRLLGNNGKMVRKMYLSVRELREACSWVREHPKQKTVIFWRMIRPVLYDIEMNLRFEITEAIHRVYKDDPNTMWRLLIVRSKYSDTKIAI